MILLIPLIAGLGLMSMLGLPLLETGLAFIFGALAWLVKMILLPFDLLIQNTMPDLANGISAINDMLGIANQYMVYVIDATMIPQTAITLIVAYYVFWGAIGLLSWSVKLALKWKVMLFG